MTSGYYLGSYITSAVYRFARITHWLDMPSRPTTDELVFMAKDAFDISSNWDRIPPEEGLPPILLLQEIRDRKPLVWVVPSDSTDAIASELDKRIVGNEFGGTSKFSLVLLQNSDFFEKWMIRVPPRLG